MTQLFAMIEAFHDDGIDEHPSRVVMMPSTRRGLIALSFAFYAPYRTVNQRVLNFIIQDLPGRVDAMQTVRPSGAEKPPQK